MSVTRFFVALLEYSSRRNQQTHLFSLAPNMISLKKVNVMHINETDFFKKMILIIYKRL